MANPLDGLNDEQIVARLKDAGVSREQFDWDWACREALLGIEGARFPTAPNPRDGEAHKYAGMTLQESWEMEHAEPKTPPRQMAQKAATVEAVTATPKKPKDVGGGAAGEPQA